MKTPLPHYTLPMMRDTPFASLMNKRIYNVLLIATPYDAFMLENDGRVDEEIFNEYTSLNLRYPPRFTRVTTSHEALKLMNERHFELVVIMPNLANDDLFCAAHQVKGQHPQIPIVVLTPFSKEMSKRMLQTELKNIEYVFAWLGNAELLLSIIKLIEDSMNAPHDVTQVGVQAIVLVEDSVRFYSSALPLLYHTILEQSKEFANEALNDHLKMLRMRGRPKVLLARNYEEAVQLCHTYADNLLGIITDFSFPREGCKDPLAGVQLVEWIRAHNKHVPIIMQSSELSNQIYAQQLNVTFVQKHAKNYANELHHCVMRDLGFGDFVITDSETGNEIGRIRNLKDLQQNLHLIPDPVLRHHLVCNHISRFLYSRALFPLAEVLRHHDASQYKDMNEARTFISQLIDRYRVMKHAGVVATFHKDSYDHYNNFTRIGKGSLGGKGRGLAFMNTFIKPYLLHESTESSLKVDIPKTVVICTDVFDDFMQQNHLYHIALNSTISDATILEAFEQAQLPDSVIDDLQTLLQATHHPIAVRSSSLLEDSHFQPFAGVYATYMVPHNNNKALMLHDICAAIKAVYASVFYAESKNYLATTQNLIDQEKMAIVLQEVVGQTHGHLFYPTLSGVARSLNFYPSEGEQPEDGVMNIAMGLGKQIVEGGKSLRLSPLRQQHAVQWTNTQTALSNAQHNFWAINLQPNTPPITHDEGYNLQQVDIRSVSLQTDATLPYVCSTYDWQNNRIMPGSQPDMGRVLISFQNLLHMPQLPLGKVVHQLLQLGKNEMGRDVEIEFAMQFTPPQTFQFFLLQIRPIVDCGFSTENLSLARQAEGADLVLSNNVLGNGIVQGVQHILYVANNAYSVKQRIDIAQRIAQVNAHFVSTSTRYVLIGAGRWGSADPALGIPVRWSQISAAAAIVESDLKLRHIDASQGSHFFQNLTSLGVPYFTIHSGIPQQMLDADWLTTVPATYEDECLRIIQLPHPLLIAVDGKKRLGIIRR